jgi:hypothetical protein
MIENIAQQRNAAATTDEDRVKVVMDGVNEKGRMYEIEELLARMNRYQDGTQFEVFVHGQMQHWLYEEIFAGELGFEDYQRATKGKPASGYMEDADPHNPINLAPNAFTHGVYIAITPLVDDRPKKTNKSSCNQ